MELIVYGSFNCPFSYLASLRADRLQARGGVELDWRAVVHDPGVPESGIAVEDELAGDLDEELEQVRALLEPGEDYPARRPPVQPNTVKAVSGYASRGGHAHELRRSLFAAFWADGEDIGDITVLDRLGCPAVPPGEAMNAWDHEWRSCEVRIVPTLVLPGGRQVPGLDAIRQLLDLAA